MIRFIRKIGFFICFFFRNIIRYYLSLSLAAELAIQNNKVLLIDADPQGNSTGILLESFNHDLAEALYGDITIDQVVTNTSV